MFNHAYIHHKNNQRVCFVLLQTRLEPHHMVLYPCLFYLWTHALVRWRLKHPLALVCIRFRYRTQQTLQIKSNSLLHCIYKAADLQMLKKWKKITVNNGQVMFNGEIYYYWPLNSSEKVDKIVGKTSFFFA